MADASLSPHLQFLLGQIGQARLTTPPERTTLVAISGIDGCGKGYITAQIVAALQTAGLRTAGINIDGWLNLPAIRFSDEDPATHFYEHALRFDDLFSQLILPLRDHRSVQIEADYAEETATAYRRHLYDFENIDMIVLEGIYLLKRELRHHYDLTIWIDCTFETALERAIARSQEGLPPEATTAAYHRIYFPAQKIHFERDNPRDAAMHVLPNDQRLG